MPAKPQAKQELEQKLLKTFELTTNMVKCSMYIKQSHIECLQAYIATQTQLITTQPCTLTQLKQLAKEFLIYWNEGIGVETEAFWEMLQQNNIFFERRDELRYALEKGHFRRVDMAMGARKHWHLMQKLNAIKQRFSPEDIERITQIVAQDEYYRHQILQKAIIRKGVPQSQQIKFNENMAYFYNCNLFTDYFTETQTNQLYQIWEQFNNEQ